MAAAGPPLHANLAPLSGFLGTWRGEGEGFYPTIAAFRYGEELTFAHAGKPVMQTGHKTWRLLADGANGGPLHAESGFWRCAAPGGGVDAVYAQASGIAEHTRGTYDAAARRIELRSAGVLNATKVAEVVRAYTLSADGATLTYEISMATTTQPLQAHLRATLTKVG